jgi:hypothetical protein
MSAKLGFTRATGLSLLPLGAFLLGPALAAVGPDDLPARVLLSVLPTFLPFAALVVVAAVTYNRTRSPRRAIGLTALSFAIALLGATVFLVAVWADASGS